MNNTIRVTGAIAASALVAGALAATAPSASADDVDKAPARTVSGGLSGPIGIERDSAGNIYVASQNNNAVVEHANNASGASTPLRTLAGAATGISSPRDIALASNGFLYVLNLNGTVNIFGPGQEGNVGPVKTFGTGAGNAFGIDIDSSGLIYVRKADRYNVYTPSATGSPAPTERSVTGLNMAFGSSIVVANGLVWTPNGAQLRAYNRLADGPAAPARTIVNAALGASEINGIDVDAQGRVYVPTFFNNNVLVFGANASGNSAPVKRLGGPATGLGGPTGLAVAPNGVLTAAEYNNARYSVFAALFPPPPVVKVPGKPRALKVAGAKRAKKRTVSWKAPASNGGSKITGYRLVVKKGSTTLLTKNFGAAKRSYTLKKRQLRNGKNVVLVKAKNKKGFGKFATKTFRVRK